MSDESIKKNYFCFQVIMPGYCVSGTVGHKILNGAKRVEFENRQFVEVKMSVEVNQKSDYIHDRHINNLHYFLSTCPSLLMLMPRALCN